MGPVVGQERCPVEHVGLVLLGTVTAAFADGRVVGNEPYVSLHFMDAEKYAAK